MLHVGLQGGRVSCRSMGFTPSIFLRALRRLGKTTAEHKECKQLSFQMRNHQRQETKGWKPKQLQGKLRNNVWWKPFRKMDTSLVGRQVGHQPLPDEFASMLVELFSGNPPNPSQPAHLTRQLWSMEELKFTVGKLKQNKGGDDIGLDGSNVLQPIFSLICPFSMTCSSLALCSQSGPSPISSCSQNHPVPRPQMISNQSPSCG